jgi:hypothetical protein
MTSCSRSARFSIVATLVLAAACRAQPAHINPDDPQTVAAVDAILSRQQAVQANQQSVEQFKKAAGACLEARGYSVR